MKSTKDRLNNIVGQIEGIKKMMDNEADCIKVLTQLKAVRSAISGVMDTVVDHQFDTCMPTLSDKDKKLLVQIKKYVKNN